MQEIWKDIKDYEGIYQVSNLGRVKSLKRVTGGDRNRRLKEIIFKQHKLKDGYLGVILYKNNIKKNFRVHRLVAEAFIVNPANKSDVNHIDGVKDNNIASNLEWNNRQENITHAKEVLNAKFGQCYRENDSRIKLVKADVIQIRNSKLKLKELAANFKVSASHVCNIRNGKKRK